MTDDPKPFTIEAQCLSATQLTAGRFCIEFGLTIGAESANRALCAPAGCVSPGVLRSSLDGLDKAAEIKVYVTDRNFPFEPGETYRFALVNERQDERQDVAAMPERKSPKLAKDLVLCGHVDRRWVEVLRAGRFDPLECLRSFSDDAVQGLDENGGVWVRPGATYEGKPLDEVGLKRLEGRVYSRTIA